MEGRGFKSSGASGAATAWPATQIFARNSEIFFLGRSRHPNAHALDLASAETDRGGGGFKSLAGRGAATAVVLIRRFFFPRDDL